MKVFKGQPFAASVCSAPFRGIFITDGSGMGGGGGSIVAAPDAGVQPAGNAVLTRAARPPETVEALIHGFHDVLSRMKPTEVDIASTRRIEFRPACLVDDELVFIGVMLALDDLVDGRFVEFETPHISGVRIASQSHYALLLHPAERTNDAYGPGTDDFEFAGRVLTELRQRIDNPDSVREQRMRELTATGGNRNDTIEVPLSVLYPDSYDETSARIREIEERSAALEPVKIMRHADFVRLVAQLVRKHYPKRNRVTGNETTWDELRDHNGIYNTKIASFYAPNDRTDGVPHIDLRKTARRSRMDHGYSPVRNGFTIRLALDESADAVRFTIARGEEEDIDESNIRSILDLYQVIVDAGCPVAIDKRVEEVALGTGMEKVSRTDSRLPKDGGYVLTPETVEVSMPLPEGAPPSLPSIKI